MSPASLPHPGPAAAPAPWRWTAQDYAQLGALGILTPEDRVELLAGVIWRKPVQNPPHARAVAALTDFFGEASARRWSVRTQLPLALGLDSLPEPDLVLARRPPPAGAGGQPGHPGPADVFLLVEVADTTLDHDRGEKRERYARAAVAEYWIVNVAERRVEVHRAPDPSAGSYRQTWSVGAESTLAPAAFVDAALPVAGLFG